MSFGVALRKSVSIGLGGIATLASGTRGFNPSLNLNFTSGVLDPRITFTRATTATFTGSNGLIQSAAINAPRFDYNPTTLESLGLLIEEQRSNLLLNSLINGTNLSTQTVTTTAVSQTLSFYGTGQIVLSGTSIATVTGTGAYPSRRTFTFTPTAGLLVLTVTGTVQYAQLEVGGFATSFIPTAASQVTRSADIAVMTGTNFSSWYNPAEGTIYCNAATVDIAANKGIWSIGDASLAFANRTKIDMTFSAGNTGRASYSVNVNGVSQASLVNTYTQLANTFTKTAAAYKQNNFGLSTNGLTPLSDSSGTVPVVTSMSIGSLNSSWAGGGNFLNGTISQISYYPQRLPNSQLQALTV